MQEGMLFHYLKNPDSEHYFEQICLELSGEIDIDIFKKAWDFVIENNEMLRTVFRWGKVVNPVQIVLKEHKLQSRYYELSGLEAGRKQKHIEEIKVNDRKEKFDLREVPFRITLCKLEEDKYEMIISNHHILYDGWSSGIILKEFIESYNDLYNGKPLKKKVKTSLKEFVKLVRNQDLTRQKTYWKEYLNGFAAQTELSVKRRKRKEITGWGDFRISLSRALKSGLERFIKENKITLSSLLYGAWGLLLQKYNNSDDVIFDATVSGRSAKVNGIEDIVGLFINTLPLRVKTHANENISGFLTRTYHMLQEWEEFENSALLDVKEYLDSCRKETLFDSVLVIDNYPLDRILLRGKDTASLAINSFSNSGMSIYDLTVIITIFNDIGISVTYNRQFFDEEIVRKLVKDFSSILQRIIKDPLQKVSGLAISPEELRKRISGKHEYEYIEGQSTGDCAVPGDAVEEKLLDLWSRVFRVEKTGIGIDTNFFDFGGHSLKATLLTARIHKELEVKVPLSEVFGLPTIRQLARYIKEAAQEPFISIEAVEEKEYYPVSSAQHRMYTLQQMEPANIAYNGSLAIVLEGRIDKHRITDVFIKLINRHESLRTSFAKIDGGPVQRIHEDVKFEIEFSGELPLQYNEILKDFIRPFDLSKAPLLRAGLIGTGGTTYLLVLDVHHIIMDGASGDILMKEFSHLYSDLPLPSLRLRYKDYSQWQHHEKNKGLMGKQEEYWLKRFEGGIPVLTMPSDYSRPAIRSFEGSHVKFEIHKEEGQELKNLASRQNTTLYIVMLAVYYILLAKLSGNEDIVVGTVIEGRSHTDLEKIIGMFVNMLALRNFPAKGKTFREFLREVNDRSVRDFENQDYQFDHLVRKLAVDRHVSRDPLFDVCFQLQEEGNPAEENRGDKGPGPIKEFLDYEKEISRSDMTFFGTYTYPGGSLLFDVEYCSKLYKKETIERFAKYYKRIVSAILTNIGSPLRDMELTGEAEREELLYGFNRTAREYPASTLHELFASQAARTPGNTAVRYLDRGGEKKTVLVELSYGQLNTRANHVAGILKKHEAGPVIGLLFDSSPEMIVALAAVLKAGCAYLPLEPQLPEERIKYILKDSGAAVVLTKGIFAEKIARMNPSPVTIFIDIDEEAVSPAGVLNPAHCSSPADTAYVIYTSGTTGRPKGVAVRHKGIVNYTCWRLKMYGYTPDDVTLQLLSYGFDGYNSNLYSSLLSGGTLLLVPDLKKMDVDFIKEVLTGSGVTNTSLVPAMYRALLDSGETKLFKDMRFVVLAGEKAGEDLIKRSKELHPGIRIINEYGPTEASVTAAANLDVNAGGTRIIGRPIANVHIYILDRLLRPAPLEVPGEIYISGAGVSRGYLNNPELTGEMFIENPYKTGTRLYKTGDLGRWLAGGDIELLGRMDRQLKIRGYRIELGEIEKQLINNKEIKAAVVIARKSARGDQEGEKYICAYLVANREQELDISKLKLSLSACLPDYMIPSYFVQIDKIPLTPNGKVDRKALPDPGIKIEDNYTAPGSELEKKLVDMWRDVLGIKKEAIGVETSFFRLGGHSLNATTLAIKIHKEFNVRVPLAEIFKTPSIRGLAGYITGAAKSIYETITPAETKEYYALSPHQKRLYILNRMEMTGISYNMPKIIELEEETEVEGLVEICRKLTERHEGFRTSFEIIDGQPVQEIHEEVSFEIEYRNLNSGPSLSAEDILRDFVRPFDLSRAPILRVGLVDVGGSHRVLLFDMHHIISDGVSHDILARDLRALYKGEELPLLKLQYKDFSQWQNRLFGTGMIKQQEEYWINQFAGEIPVLNIPTDYVRPGVRSYEGDRVWFEIGEEETGALKRMALEGEATLFMVLLVLYYILLSKICGQEDIVIGVPAAGRQHEDLQGIIGMFVNTLALRNYPRGDQTFREFLAEVKTRTFEAFENQDYQFDYLVKNVSHRRDTSRNPLFDVMFNFQTAAEPSEKIAEGGITGMTSSLGGFKYEDGPAKFDLMLRGVENSGGLFLNIEYRAKLFKKETIEKFVRYFGVILSSVLRKPDIRLSELEVIPDKIREERLSVFNAELENE
jgi:tyrocidine synthetase-3